MYQLFHERSVSSAGGYRPPEFNRLRDGLRQSIDKIIAYRQSNTRALLDSHLLIGLLQSLNISLHLPVEIYVDKVGDAMHGVVTALKMTSPLSVGKVHTEGVFYRRRGERIGVGEVIIANEDTFDIQDFKQNWRSYDPIRVLHHPCTDLALNVPDGRVTQSLTGYSVISINVPMLAAQYRAWRHERAIIERQESPRTMGQFLMEVPLPNMLYTHVEVALFNRMMAIYYGKPLPNIRNSHPFALPDWTGAIDQVLTNFIANMLPKKPDFDTLLSSFPTVWHRDYHEVVRLPDLSYVHQMQWPVLLARMEMVAWLVQQNQAQQNERNRQYLTQLRTYLVTLDGGKYLANPLNPAQYAHAITFLREQIVPYL